MSAGESRPAVPLERKRPRLFRPVLTSSWIVPTTTARRNRGHPPAETTTTTRRPPSGPQGAEASRRRGRHPPARWRPEPIHSAGKGMAVPAAMSEGGNATKVVNRNGPRPTHPHTRLGSSRRFLRQGQLTSSSRRAPDRDQGDRWDFVSLDRPDWPRRPLEAERDYVTPDATRSKPSAERKRQEGVNRTAEARLLRAKLRELVGPSYRARHGPRPSPKNQSHSPSHAPSMTSARWFLANRIRPTMSPGHR